MESELIEGRKKRLLTGYQGFFFSLTAFLMVLFHIYVLTINPVDPWFLRSIHLTFAATLTFLLLPATKKSSLSRFSILDLFLCFLSWSIVFYLFMEFQTLLYRAGVAPSNMDIVFAALSITLLLEITRRLSGWVLPLMAFLFIIYSLIGNQIPGIFRHKGYSFGRTMSFLFSIEGIYGLPMNASALYVFLFIVFGAFLQTSGAAKFFIDFALSIAGRARGGPAKVSIVSSSLFGTVSGSSVANVVVDGVINIPMMKATGFRADDAGAIEAVTSTGGQIVPPVMGAAAFVMAEILGIPYSSVMVAAIIPAALYYVAIFWMIDFHAARSGLRGLRGSELPSFKKTILYSGHLTIPVIILLFQLMVLQFSPFRAALWAIAASVVVSWIRKENRMGIAKIYKAMAEGAQGSMEIAATCGCAGIIVGILSLTGMGLKIATMVISYSYGSLFLALLLTMIVTLILGMGMPTVAAYAITATAMGPAIIQMGIPPLVTHMFIFYFACISAITPPVALAAYAAAAISGANMWRVGLKAVKFGSAGFIIPYMFVYGQSLLLVGNWGTIITSFITATIGCGALAAGIQGWLLKKAVLWERCLLIIAALLLIKPGIYTDLVGLSLLAIVLINQKFSKKQE